MKNIVFDVPLAANTQTEGHMFHVSRNKLLINKTEIYFVCVKISFKIRFASGCRQNGVLKASRHFGFFLQLNIVNFLIEI